MTQRDRLNSWFRACFAWLLMAAAIQAAAGEWTHWRGPGLDGHVEEANLPAEWSKDGKNLLWHAPYGSRSTPIVMDGKVHLINSAGDEDSLTQERVMALDVETGKVVWEHRFNVFLTDIVTHRLGWAQLSGDPETGYIYAQGVQGLLFCFDKKGKVVWSHSLTEQFGRISGYGGRTHSPIVEQDKVIISCMSSGWGPHGRPQHRILALDKRTGESIWWTGVGGAPADTTYSVPVVADVNGVRTLFTGLADGSIQAVQANTGKPIWNYRLSKRGINTSVVYHDGKVYASHSEENLDTNVMGAVVCIDATAGEGDITDKGTVWRVNGLGVGYASPALVDGMLLTADNAANLIALNAKTGDKMWEFNYGNAARGSATYADGKVYIGEVPGKFHILSVDKSGAKRLNEESFSKPNGSPIEIFSSPSVSDGRVFLATKDDLYVIGTHPKKPGSGMTKTNAPKPAKPGPAAQLLVRPAETWIQNGASQPFTAHAYDAKGVYIGKVDAEWSVQGLKGAIDGKGVFKAEASDNTQGGAITAKHQGMTGTARLRVLPSLPYREDFEDLPLEAPPAGWITSKPKSHVIEMDGNKVLKKTADRAHPAFARMRNYMLPPMDQGYTVQADMLGQSKKRRFYPDMGLINSRYLMILLGTERKPTLRLVTWAPVPRLQKDVLFDWEPDKWYTMKMAYSIKDGKGWVRGKVWPQGEAEPSDWTIEMMDPIPNEGGSPALYGYSVAISEKSHGTEVFYDNVIVTPNE